MKPSKGLFFLCCFFCGFWANAQLLLPELRLSLEADRLNVNPKEILFLRVKITNASGHDGSILVPHAQNYGKSLFQLRVCRIDSVGGYIPVFESPTELSMDTSAYRATESFWHLDQNESYTLPFFINDEANAGIHVESSIQLPSLPSGKYAFQMVYDPVYSQYFRYAFIEDRGTDPIPEDQVSEYPDHFFWEGRLVSNWVEMELDNKLKPTPVKASRHCSLCGSIEKERWTCVKRKWERLSGKGPHPAIAWRYGGPQAIILTLPSYASYDFVFQTESRLVYTSFHYRLGKIFGVRSRLAQLFYWLGARKPPFKTSDVDKVKLMHVRVLGDPKVY
jgi:hypothetical protein